jgi:flagellar hook-associated protein 3 FlgL
VQSAGASAALADQVDAIRNSLIKVANTTYNGRPIFGGTTSGTAAYDNSGNYVGDTGAVSRTVGEKVTVQINQTGPQAFGSGPSDLFTLLSDISTNLRTNPSALSANLTALDGALSTISSAQAGEGAAYRQVQNAQAVSTGVATNLASQLSDIQDIDLAEMAVQVTSANVTYQAALQTTANVRQLSLLEFLR